MSSTMRTPRTEGENGKPAAIREKMRRAAHGVLGWRNWSLPVKLAAVTLVPVLFAVVLGALQISAQVGSAGQYAQITKVITLGDQVRDTLHAVQRERNAAAVAKGRNEQDIKKAFGPADSALTALRGAVGDPAQYGNAIAQQWQRADFQLRRISTARSYWGTDVDQALRDYDQVARGLLGFDRALAGGVREAALVQRADALYDVSAAREEISQQQALVLAGIARSSLTAGEISDLRDSRARLVSDQNDFVAVADPADNARYQHTVSGSDVNRRGYLLSEATSSTPTERLANNSDAATGTAASPPGTRPLQVSTASWNAASNGTARKLGTASNSLAAGLHDAAGALQSSATTAAVVAAVVLLVMLVLAAVIVVVVARQLLRSIRTLHRSAREVAEITLPEVVEEIRQGRPVEERIINVEVDSDDEVGQLARAFDAVHLQARRLAVEQAALRANYSSVFVNLSRRSQSLVQRQLRLIEQLERDEEDPDQLGTLFQLDHLATRMRRNNENLMVLSGAETSRGVNQQPVAVSDLLRAAVSEVEQYQRVVVAPPPTAHVLGYACADLVRLIAELLDNATAFSAPTTQVSVLTVLESDGSVTLEVVDEGVGMREQELADANARLYGDSVDEVPLSRRMGLFVVGRLAERHDFAVELFGGTDVIGLRASVTVPAELVLGSADRVRLSDTGSNPVVPTLPAAAAPFTPIRRGASAARP
ncbi:MAG: sensor histidine kinase, partial [Sciscionella sp.]